jgi:hypothetical protein
MGQASGFSEGGLLSNVRILSPPSGGSLINPELRVFSPTLRWYEGAAHTIPTSWRQVGGTARPTWGYPPCTASHLALEFPGYSMRLSHALSAVGGAYPNDQDHPLRVPCEAIPQGLEPLC